MCFYVGVLCVNVFVFIDVFIGVFVCHGSFIYFLICFFSMFVLVPFLFFCNSFIPSFFYSIINGVENSFQGHRDA